MGPIFVCTVDDFGKRYDRNNYLFFYDDETKCIFFLFSSSWLLSCYSGKEIGSWKKYLLEKIWPNLKIKSWTDFNESLGFWGSN